MTTNIQALTMLTLSRLKINWPYNTTVGLYSSLKLYRLICFGEFSFGLGVRSHK
jgi:hypothetical protein